MEKRDDLPYGRYPFLERLIMRGQALLSRLSSRPVPGSVQTEEELKKIIDDGEKQGVIEEDEHEMLHSILKFGDTIVREVMIPRIEMSCLKEDTTYDQVMDYVIKDGHSRIPVYKERIDEIVGIVYVKDLLGLQNQERKDFHLSSIMRPAFFIPESKRISELLREFQRRKIHLAVVVDEYGGTAGLVTIEDLLEELVGEIEDEYDVNEAEKMSVIDEETVFADGRLEIDQIEEYFKVILKGEDYETVSGLLFHLFEKIPQPGESIDYQGLRFTIDKVGERKIHRVKIRRLEDPDRETVSSCLQEEKA